MRGRWHLRGGAEWVRWSTDPSRRMAPARSLIRVVFAIICLFLHYIRVASETVGPAVQRLVEPACRLGRVRFIRRAAGVVPSLVLQPLDLVVCRHVRARGEGRRRRRLPVCLQN